MDIIHVIDIDKLTLSYTAFEANFKLQNKNNLASTWSNTIFENSQKSKIAR